MPQTAYGYTALESTERSRFCPISSGRGQQKMMKLSAAAAAAAFSL